MDEIELPVAGRPGEIVHGTRTPLSISRNCEDWKVPSDHGGTGFGEWWDSLPAGQLRVHREIAERAWQASVTHHCATLRRIGWLDQKGRVWTEIPSAAGFDGGSLTALLVDIRE